MQSFISSSLQRYGVVDTGMPTPHGPPAIPGASNSVQRHGIDDGPRSSFNRSEENVVVTHSISLWDDGSDRMLRNGSIVFVCRNSQPGQGTNMVEWSKLNDVLRQGAALYRARVGPIYRGGENDEFDESTGDTDDSTPNHSLRQVDLDQQHTIHHSLNNRANLVIAMKQIRKLGGLIPSSDDVSYVGSRAHKMASAEVAEAIVERDKSEHKTQKGLLAFYKDDKDQKFEVLVSHSNPRLDTAFGNLLNQFALLRDTVARYGGVSNIVRYWNFLGVVNNTNEGKGLALRPTLMPHIGTVNIPRMVVNTIVEYAARTPNRWGNHVNEYTRCYAVLTRERRADGTYDDYQVIPWSTNTPGEVPPSRLLLHPDYTGAAAVGHYWYVGKVEVRRMGKADTSTRRLAAGLRPSPEGNIPSVAAAFEALAKLETLEIQVRRYR